MNTLKTSIVAGVCILGAAPAFADDAPSSLDVSLLSVPDVPALSALDATSNKIDRPDSASGLTAAISNAFNRDGTLNAGVGVEVSPHLFGVDKSWSYSEYTGSDASAFFRRLVTQSALSFGTGKIDETATTSTTTMMANADVRAAVGWRIVLINHADPLLAPGYAGRVEWARAQCQDKPDADVQQCRVDSANAYKGTVVVPWNAAGLYIAGAESWRLTESKLNHAAKDTLSNWIAGALPLGDVGQLAVGASWDHVWAAKDTVVIAARLRLGGDHYRFTGDGTWFAKRADDTAAKGRWAVGLETKLAASGWLVVSAGTDLGGANKNEVSILSSLKYAFSPTPSFTPSN